jgi:hypothetical protein
MGGRLRGVAVALLAVGFCSIAAPAMAEEFASCWVAREQHALTGETTQITRCRVAGGDVIDYASDSAVPAFLYPNVGTDLTGPCWYYTSAVTRYLILALYANGDADMGIDEPGAPGGIIILGDILPRCTSEPAPAIDPVAMVWEYVSQYIHAPPTPGLNPRPGQGVTGLDTFVAVAVPADHATQLSGGGTTLDIEIEVSAVIVDWGDGTSDTYPARPDLLTGYPDGVASHVFETKVDDASLSVSYDWTARWRVVGGSWLSLAVPNTTTAVGYPVSEIVSVLRP